MPMIRALAPALAVMACGAGGLAMAADHIDAPFTTGTPNADINDLYAFTRNENVVLVMTIHPFANSETRLNPDYLYQFKIDLDQDNVEDRVIQVQAVGTGADQRYQIAGPIQPPVLGAQGNEAVPADFSAAFNETTNSGDIMAFVGLRDDPFFFDLAQYQAILDDVRENGEITAGGFNDPGVDTLGEANTLAIVLEMPRATLGSGTVGVWATSSQIQSGAQ